jgi:membrane dipeptidase
VLERLRLAGVDHVSLSAAAGRETAAETLARLGHLRRAITAVDDIVIAHDGAAICAARAEGRFSVSFHLQTATPFSFDLDLVDGFRAAGVTRAILAYNEANAFADGCHEPRNGGLTALGRDLLRRMDLAGMIVDLSQCGARTALEALEAPLARAPVFSHSNARALFDHERNIADDLIRACGRRVGAIGINGVSMFLGADGPGIPAAMARHAAHAAAIAGAECVVLGLDFMFLEGSDYGFYHAAKGRWPRGYPDPPWDFIQPEQIGDLVAALEAVGFRQAEIAGIMAGNYLRLCT